MVYTEYDLVAQGYPGWPLSDIKEMSIREREFWVSRIQYRTEMRKWQEMMTPNRR